MKILISILSIKLAMICALGLFFASTKNAFAATEFISVISENGGDYNSLSSWASAIGTNLASVTTQVFSGNKNGTISDSDGSFYLCRQGIYQGHYGFIKHATNNQILLTSITGAVVEQSGDRWYPNLNCIGNNYFTISDGGDSVIAVAKIDGAWNNPDITPVAINNFITSVENHIKIYTAPSARHDGKWSNSKYRLGDGLVHGKMLNIGNNYTNVEGLQIYFSGAFDDYGIFLTSTENKIYNNLIRGTSGGSAAIGSFHWGSASPLFVFNNIIFGAGNYGITSFSRIYAYNNTISGNWLVSGLYSDGSLQRILAKNNIVVSESGPSYSGIFFTGSDYNLSNDNNSTFGINDKKNQTVLFKDAASYDFHLLESDTSAHDAGTNLSADIGFSFGFDFENQNRSEPWDMGADEISVLASESANYSFSIHAKVLPSYEVVPPYTAHSYEISVGAFYNLPSPVDYYIYCDRPGVGFSKFDRPDFKYMQLPPSQAIPKTTCAYSQNSGIHTIKVVAIQGALISESRATAPVFVKDPFVSEINLAAYLIERLAGFQILLLSFCKVLIQIF